MGAAQQNINKRDYNQFSSALFNEINKKQEENIFLSPYNILSALIMCYAGAAGETKQEMSKALCLQGINEDDIHQDFLQFQQHLNSQKDVELSVANKIWPEKTYTFLPQYIELLKKFHLSEVNPQDFKSNPENSRSSINKWVEVQTKDKIKGLLPPYSIEAHTRLVITTAVYFKGDWQFKFKKEQTKKDIFYIAPNQPSKQEVQMMYQQNQFLFFQNTQFKAVSLPYKGNNLSMIVVLPTLEFGIKKMIEHIKLDSLQNIVNKMERKEVDLHLPRFKFEYSINLGDTLKTLGMVQAFSDVHADFSGMDGLKRLFVSNIFTKAFIEVNEEGSEAAAATAVVLNQECLFMPCEFYANHPFLFYIVENKFKNVLFMGQFCGLE